MKNIIKKIIPVFALALVAFFGAKTIDAATVEFVPYSGFPTVGMVSNYSDCEGCPTWSSSVSADPGETITVSVYVKNIGTTSAPGTKVSMTPSYADSTSHNINVKISSGTIIESGNVTVNVTGGEGQTLSYHDGSATVLYYPCLDGLTCGVDTTSGALFGSGVSIGTVPAAGTHYYAYVQAKFDVSESAVVVDDPECDDNVDNDGDGDTDYPNDPGCSSYSDDDEYNAPDATEDFDVTTENASNENEDSAQLNGSVDVGEFDNVSLYFEWGNNNAVDDLDNTEDANDSETDFNTDFEFTLDGLDADTEYFYRACADPDGASAECGDIESFTTDGSDNQNFDVSTDSATEEDENSAQLNGSIDAGDFDVSNCWFEYGTDDNVSDLDDDKDADCDINDGDSEDINATITGLDDNTEYFFRACAEDDDGDEQCGSIESFETDSGDIVIATPDFDAPFVVTTVVTNVTGSSAKLNGLLTNDGNSSSTGYFEWGSTNSLGLTTQDQTLGLGDGIAFGNFIVGLQPTTIYYYRACARNGGGTVCGDTLSFRTVSTIIPGPTVAPRPTVISVGGGSGNSRVMLEITSPYDNSCPSDINDYTVKYRNISGRALSDVILRVTLPSDVSFRRASQGDFTESDNTLTVELNELSVNEEGEVFISGDVTNGVSGEDIIVATAVMAYTYQTTLGQEDAIAYKIHDVTRCGSSLGAFAFLGADFLPNSFLGWILLIIAILLLVLVTRRLAERRTVTHTSTTSRSINDLPH